MKPIHQKYEIKAPQEKVWEALVDPKSIEAWGAGPAKMNDKVGFKFSLWGGDIHGKNIEVIKFKKLKQEWYGGDWDKPSILTFKFSEKEGKTKVDLLHEDVPDKEHKNISEGWKDYYMIPLKDYVESK